MHSNRGKSKLPWSPPSFRDLPPASTLSNGSNPANGMNSDMRASNSNASEDVAMTTQNGNDETVRAPIQPRIERLVDGSQFAQLRVSSATQKRKANSGLTGGFEPDFGESSSSKRPAIALAELFRPPADLLFVGTFELAKRYAIMNRRWLLVDIQKSDEFTCATLNRDVYRNEIVHELIRENLILCQYDEASVEGIQFCAFYHVSSFPFVALVDPRTGELAYRVRTFEPSAFLEVLSEFLASRPLNFDEHQVDAAPQVGSVESITHNGHSTTALPYTSKNGLACNPDNSDNRLSVINRPQLAGDTMQHDQPDFVNGMHSHLRNTSSFNSAASNQLCSTSFGNSTDVDSQQKMARVGERSTVLSCIEAFSCLSVSPNTKPCCDETASHSSHESASERSPTSGSSTEWTTSSECCTHSAASRISQLLVRLPDGSRTRIYVHAERTIEEFLVHVSRCALTPDRFRFVTDFPRIDLGTAASRSLTFEQHQLVPSGTIYIEEF